MNYNYLTPSSLKSREAESPLKSQHFLIPLLCASIYIMNALLVLLFRRISADKTVSYTLIGIAEILAVAVPAMLYNSLRPKDECKTGFYFSADKTSVVILTSIAMTFGAMAISTLSAHIGLTGGKETVLENVSLPALDARLGQMLYAMVTVALVPAVCEEFLCRVVIYREYEKYGPIAAITVSAFAFAFLHFSLGKFPMYIFCGFLLGFLRMFTDSALAPIIAHFFYNAFALFYHKFFGTLTEQLSEFTLVFFALLFLCLLFLSLAFGEAARVFRAYYAKSHYAVRPSKERAHLPAADCVTSCLKSPSLWLCVALYVFFSIVL